MTASAPYLDEPSLGAAAKFRLFGAAVSVNHLSEPPYTHILNSQFTSITPEVEMKWDATEPAPGSFSFDAADTLVRYAHSHHMRVRGHTLVWHTALPSWVNESADLLQAMRNHIIGVMQHYTGHISYWDVVNEAFDEDGSRRKSIFQERIGDLHIEEAFRVARATDPYTRLCYNDYGIEGINAKSDAVYDLVRDFKRRGIPLDCVGFQCHLLLGTVPPDMQTNLQRFADLGVEIHITELDIRMPVPASTAELQQQAEDYRKVIQACLAIPHCTSITTWGITDKYSWVPGTFPGYGAALLFDENYKKKPAYHAVLQALREAPE
ncbi:endo-1,4-beta-xylanase [Thermosporothrix hazakensis]|jgi:endo-1,4-beta-xylanase|uniref:Beta-xylanase n=1 Tax=Thermosporothrix hazakensis TaxID=644383 RepID=A0A326UAF4_THEHA|nr:endo-1,4-beta-xylanase [Thermosporothrix hazakensis]PZW32559.1 endo-1,4-beta-xylanase [Thermosporothrix hazakensis]GCE49912.1 hypothetical protein KTH_47810 [Thermosporothrix hazakensis]